MDIPHDITGLEITTFSPYISGSRLDWTANSCRHLPCRGSVQQLKGCYGFLMNGRIFGHLNFHGLRPLRLARTVNIIRHKRCVKSKMAAFQSSDSQRIESRDQPQYSSFSPPPNFWVGVEGPSLSGTKLPGRQYRYSRRGIERSSMSAHGKYT
jgi:hypothetical protein